MEYMSLVESLKTNWALALKEGHVQGSVHFAENYANLLTELAPIHSSTLKLHMDVLTTLNNHLKSIRNVYSTLQEKVKAYEDFFNSDDSILLVIGDGGSGKSYALHQAKKPCYTVVYSESRPKLIECKESDNDRVSIVYHLYKSDSELVKELQKKYNPRIVRFEKENS
jgi:hypothetical protein